MGTDADALTRRAEQEQLLATGDLTVVAAMAEASNATLYAHVEVEGRRRAGAIYKPASGERPLWDFPTGTLHLREVATYRLAVAAELDVVPATVLREGPFGPGSVQLWVGPEPEEAMAAEPGGGVVDVCPPSRVPDGWKRVLRASDGRRPVVLCHADDPRLAAMAVLDVLANNADRKGGHIIDRLDGRLAGVDHGLTFNVEPKLRTVLWGWTGTPVPQPLLAAVRRVQEALAGEFGEGLTMLLDHDELAALDERVGALLASGLFPGPSAGGPAIPWPAF